MTDLYSNLIRLTGWALVVIAMGGVLIGHDGVDTLWIAVSGLTLLASVRR